MQTSKEFYMVIDFEANCSDPKVRDHEIIEFPAVLVQTSTGEIISEFHNFIKMTYHNKLSKFIKKLTSITDERVNNGVSWSESLKLFEKWCKDNNVTSENTTVVTCGDWDLKTMLPNQLYYTETYLSSYLSRFPCKLK